MTVVMAMGDFDLSVGSMASLAGIVAALVFIAGGPPVVAIARGARRGPRRRRDQRRARRLRRHPAVRRDARRDDRLQRPGVPPIGGKTLFGAAIPHGFSDFARGGIPLGSTGLVVAQPDAIVALGALVAVVAPARADVVWPPALRHRRQQRGRAARRRAREAFAARRLRPRGSRRGAARA